MTDTAKPNPRFPVDAMVERASRAYYAALDAALDRRTGPKCRRIENADDYEDHPKRRNWMNTGRRNGDVPSGRLPRKSARLAREAAEREERRKEPPGIDVCIACSQPLPDRRAPQPVFHQHRRKGDPA